MTEEKPDSKLEVFGETCPIPLVETRKAIRGADEGDIIEVSGDHNASQEEIPMAVKEMGLELLEVKEVENGWKIRIRVSESEE